MMASKPWLRSATDEARRILTQLGPAAEVAIVRAAEGTDHPTELTRDHRPVNSEINDIILQIVLKYS